MVRSEDNQFIIPFVGLKQGKHEFTFDITDAFFETFEYSIIQQGDVHIDFVLDKKDTMMVGEFQLEGRVKTACDRCNDSIEISIQGEFRLVYKFATEDEEDESIVVIFPEEFEINIKDTLLEFMNVLLPSRSVHDEGECNEEMLDYLSKYIVNPLDEDEDDFEDDDDFDDDEDDFDDDEEYDDEDNDSESYRNDEGNEDQPNDRPVDPRWEALRKLK